MQAAYCTCTHLKVGTVYIVNIFLASHIPSPNNKLLLFQRDSQSSAKRSRPLIWLRFKYQLPSPSALDLLSFFLSLPTSLRLQTPTQHSIHVYFPSILKLYTSNLQKPAFSTHPKFIPKSKMPPKAAAEKKPTATAGKAPAGKAPASDKKEAGKKTAAASGDKKKRTKTRKETYSSYIYKGGSMTWMESTVAFCCSTPFRL